MTTKLSLFSKPFCTSPLLATLVLLLLSVWHPLLAAADDDVTVFDFGDASFIEDNKLTNGTSLPPALTKGDITLAFKKVGRHSPMYFADYGIAYLYTKNTLTITSTGKPIKSVVFTAYTDGKTTKLPSDATFSTSLGQFDYATCTWSGEASEVMFKNIATGSTRIGLQRIEVYTEEQTTTKVAPALTFSSENTTTTVGTSVKVTLNGAPDDATVSYASSAVNIATVDATGTVTPVAPGFVTITATTSSTDTYLQGAAQCNLMVTPTTTGTSSAENLYAKVKNQDDIIDGGIYLIVYEGDDKTLAMGDKNDTGLKRVPVSVTTEDSKITAAANTEGKPYEVFLAAQSAKNTYQLLLSNGMYLQNSGNKELKQVTTPKSNNLKYINWLITYNNDVAGTVTIENGAYTEKNYVKYQLNSNYFSAYAESPNTASVTLYGRSGTVKILTTEGYTTLYTDCAFIMPEGLQGSTITGVDTEGTLLTQWEFQPGDIVPAYTGLLLKGTYNTTYTYQFVNTTLENSVNCLAGTLTKETPTADDASNFYYLTYSYSKDTNTKTLGFYLWNSDGTPGENAAGHAYLKLPKTLSNAKGFAFDTADTTGIHHATTSASSSSAIYTLSGLRVNSSDVRNLPAGVYIIGGQKVVVR